MGLNDGGYISDEELCGYSEAMDEISNYLDAMLSYFCQINSIDYMIGKRIKKRDSIKNKIVNKNIEEIHDIAGVRIVFCDLEDKCELNKLDEEILGWGKNKQIFFEKFNDAVERYNNGYIKAIYDFVDFLEDDGRYYMLKTKDYISYPKENSGYQSFHIVVIASNGYPVEIQLRNLVQHYFAQFEHDVYYKADSNTRNEFGGVCSKCADVLKSMKKRYFSSSKDSSKKLVYSNDSTNNLRI